MTTLRPEHLTLLAAARSEIAARAGAGLTVIDLTIALRRHAGWHLADVPGARTVTRWAQILVAHNLMRSEPAGPGRLFYPTDNPTTEALTACPA